MFLHRLRPTAQSGKKVRATHRPALETLEDRLVPATLHWRPTVDNYWNTAANWVDDNGNPAAYPPGQEDIASFDVTKGTDSDCIIKGPNTSVLALRSEKCFTHSLTIKGILSVGADDKGTVGSYWKSGNIVFQPDALGEEELDIYSQYSATTKGFDFQGGSVANGLVSDVGTVYVGSSAYVQFSFVQGDIVWGANLNIAGAGTKTSAGEVDFVSGGSGQLLWNYDSLDATPNISGPASRTPSIINYGTMLFRASDSSDTVSGIRASRADAASSLFNNFGYVEFSTSTGHKYHEDLPFMNGNSATPGTLKIFDDVSADFENGVFTTSYGNLAILQFNPASEVALLQGKIILGANVLITAGNFRYGNQAGAANHTVVVSNAPGKTTVTMYVQGGTLWGDTATQGKNASLYLYSVNLTVGTTFSPNTKLRFDITTVGGTTYQSYIQTDAAFTVQNRVTLNLNVSGGRPVPTGYISVISYASASFPTIGAFVDSYTGDWKGWSWLLEYFSSTNSGSYYVYN
jgi:hypothetical protein